MLDPNKKLTTAIGTSQDLAYSVVMQPDGKIVVGGYSLNANGLADFALVRYNSDGSLDTSFDSDGKVTTDIGTLNDFAFGVAIQADGKILITGHGYVSASGTTDFALIRYNANGSLDTGFGTGGIVTTNINGFDDTSRSVAVQADGKIIVAGSSNYATNSADFALVRYNTNGTLDTTFDGDGKLTTAIGTSQDLAYSVVMQPDGKIVVGGYSLNANGLADFALVRYNSDGSLDTSFDSDGKVTTDIGTLNDFAFGVAIQADGKILITGHGYVSASGTTDFALIRYNANGSLDTGFGTGGIVTTNINGFDDTSRSVAVQADGKIIVAGSSNYATNSADFALVRYNTNGTLDTTFDGDGKLTTAIGTSQDLAYSVVLQPDGKIVVGGYSLNANGLADFALVRYNSDGSLPINNTPVATAASATTNEDTAKTGTLAGTDLDGNTLTFAKVADPSHGTVTVNATTGAYTYTPTANYSGTDSFTFKVNDGTVDSAAATVSLTIDPVNDAPTGSVTISGTATQGQVLTAANTLADVDGLGTISYQWRADGVNISGATNATLTLAQAQVGKVITVAASYTDLGNTSETVTSSATTPVSGGSYKSPYTGHTYELILGSYTWAQAFAAANAKSLQSESGYLATITSSAEQLLLQNYLASSGLAMPGIFLGGSDSAVEGQWRWVSGPESGTQFWSGNANGQAVSGRYSNWDSASIPAQPNTDANASTEDYLWVTVDANWNNLTRYKWGDSPAGETAAYLVEYSTNLDTPRQGLSFSGSSGYLFGTDSNLPTASQARTLEVWFKTTKSGSMQSVAEWGGLGVSGGRFGLLVTAEGNPYFVGQSADLVSPIVVNDGQWHQVTVTYTGTVVSLYVDGVLSVSSTSNSPGFESYSFSNLNTRDQILRIGQSGQSEKFVGEIQSVAVWSKALSASEIVAAAQGVSLADASLVSYYSLGTVSTTATSVSDAVNSTTILSIVSVNAAPTGSVTISGTATQGQVLTAANTLADVDGLGTISYQWKADGVNISGATGSTFTLTQAEVGKAITVVASYTDVGNTLESMASAATAAVVNVNDVPVATVASATTNEDTAKTGTLAGTDLDGNTLTFAKVADPSHGTVTVNATTGAYTYTPTANYSGTDSFTFKVNDGTVDSAAATVSITVSAVNDVPVATVASATTNEDTTKTGTLAGTDLDGNTLTFAKVADPSHGTVTVNATTGAYTYTPTANYSGTDSFTFKVNDGTVDSAAATVSLTIDSVNDAPTGSVTISGTVTQGQVLTAANTLADVDGLGTISYQWRADGVNISGATGSTFTLTQAEVGKAITVVASYTDVGNTLESMASAATAAVVNVNDVPVATVASATTNEDTAKTGTLAGTDLDGNTLTFAKVADPSHGTVTVNATTGAYTYTPTANYSGTDSFTFKVNDGTVDSAAATVSLTIDPVNDAPTGSVTISGTATQGQVLTAANTLADVDGLGTISYQWRADGVNISGATNATLTLAQAQVGKVITVAASYTDLGNTSETVTSSATTPVSGGSYKSPYTGHTYELILGSYTWAQAFAAANAKSLQSESGYLATITSSAEQLLLQNYLASSGLAMPGIFLGGSDSAVEGQWRWVSGPESGTQFWSGNANGQAVSGRYSNWDSASIPAQPNTDANASTEDYLWVTVDANWNNLTRYKWGDSPAGETAAYLVEYSTNLDTPRQGLSFSGSSGYLFGTDSNLPTASQARTLEVWFKTTKSGSMQSVAEWGGLGVSGGRFGLLVTAEGNPYFVGQSADLVSPIVVNDGQWHQVTVTYTGTVVSLYVDGVLSVSSTSNSPGFESYSFSNLNTRDQILRIGQSGQSEKFVGEIQSVAVWSKALSASEIVAAAQGVSLADASLVSYYSLGTVSTTATSVSDAVNSTTILSIVSVNAAPTGSVTISGTATQGQVLTAANTLADVDGLGTISYQWKADGVNISGATGSTFTLTQAEVGKAITVVASYTDVGNTLESMASAATAAVVNVNDVPVATVASATTNEDTAKTGTLAGTDLDGNTLTFAKVADPSHGTVTVNATTGAYTYTPTANYSGTDSFTFKVNDGTVDSAAATVSITVSAVNDVPVATVASATTNEDTTKTGTLAGTDLDGNTLTFAKVADPSHGTVTVNATTGAYTYTPTANYSGTDSFTFKVNDGTVDSAAATVSLTIDSVNDAPTGSVTISGTVTQGQVLTAANTLADVDGLGTISYQWRADGVNISGATNATLTLAQAQVGKVITVAASYTDLGNTSETVTSSATTHVITQSVGSTLTGHIYEWKSHNLLSGVDVSMAGLSTPLLPNNSKPLYQLKNVEYNSTMGEFQVGLWMNLSSAIKNFDVILKNTETQSLGFTFNTSLFPAGWIVQSNADATGGLSVGGFGDVEFAGTAVQLGTITCKFTGTTQNVKFIFEDGSVGGVTATVQQQLSSYAVNVYQVSSVSGRDGKYSITALEDGNYSLDVSRSLSSLEAGSAINSADALAALKIAVGRNPNLDGSAISPYQLIAADVNQDGKVTTADALAILKMAIKRSDAPLKELLFVSESEDFWDEAADNGQGGSTISRTNVTWNKDLHSSVDKDTTLNFLAVLKGDVNGTWTGPTAEVQILPNSYFYDLVKKGLGPLSTWGVIAA